MPTSSPTPGPWTVRRRRGGTAWQVMAADRVVAELVAGSSSRAPAEIAAMVRLMASAPRLLASLDVLSLLLRRHFTAAAPGRRPDRRLMLTACAAADAVLREAGARPAPRERARIGPARAASR